MEKATDRRKTGRRRLVYPVLVVLVFCVGFAYGWPAGRRGLFPYPQLMALCESVRRAPSPRDVHVAPDAPGRWHQWRADGREDGPPPDQQEEMERLMALGYLSGSRVAPSVAGVTVYERGAASEGLNLLVSGHGPEAVLTDMEGRVLHRWRYDFWDVWPDAELPGTDLDTQFWRRVHLFENGDVLAVYDWLGLIKLDSDSNLIWAYPGTCHHDLFVSDDGPIYVLEQEARAIPRIRSKPVLVDFIAVLSPDGELKRRVPVLEAFERSRYAPLLQRIPGSGDIFHTNTIELLDGTLEHVSPAFRSGNVLICVRDIQTVAVVDMDAEAVVWALAGRWRAHHQPTILGNGHMLLFNNEAGENVSEVVEFDPFTQEVHWSYRGDDEVPFYTSTCGSNQRLPNGNTLITESDNGRAFEVAPDGTIVWEFVSPYRAGKDGELIATLLEAVRLPADFPVDWLEEQQ